MFSIASDVHNKLKQTVHHFYCLKHSLSKDQHKKIWKHLAKDLGDNVIWTILTIQPEDCLQQLSWQFWQHHQQRTKNEYDKSKSRQ